MNWDFWLPVVFWGLLGLTMTIYIHLDGFDLGVGMLMPRAEKAEQDLMVASIGPFWDANETWLVLGLGVLFISFPKANTMIMGALYLPACVMMFGLILRGAAYELRVKSATAYQGLWNMAFMIGSFTAALAQGYMLGRFITGFAVQPMAYVFAVLIMLCVPAAYVALAACWVLGKTESSLQAKARDWAQLAWYAMALCMILISVTTPLLLPSVAARWFDWPNWLYLMPIPILTAISMLRAKWLLAQTSIANKRTWQPFWCLVVAQTLCALGLGISIFPDMVIGQIDVWQAAASTPALLFVLVGVAITVPMIIAYTVFAYWVFRGKASTLSYHLHQ